MRKRAARRATINVLAIIAAVLIGIYGVTRAHSIRAFPRGFGLQSEPSPVSNLPENVSRECLPDHGVFRPSYREMLERGRMGIDANGVILRNYGGEYLNASWQYSPLLIVDFGLAGMRAWCETGDPLGLQIALDQADWLRANADITAGFATWRYDFPNWAYNAPVGWTSSMANGFTPVLFVQLYHITDQVEYLDMAERAVQSFTVPVEAGGVRHVLNDGSVWFEEVAHPQAIPSQILNGHIYAVQGLGYYADHAGSELAARLTLEGITAVRNSIHEFDVGNGTRYDRFDPENTVSVHHYAHAYATEGLIWMAERTNDEYLREWAYRYYRMVTAFR